MYFKNLKKYLNAWGVASGAALSALLGAASVAGAGVVVVEFPELQGQERKGKEANTLHQNLVLASLIKFQGGIGFGKSPSILISDISRNARGLSLFGTIRFLLDSIISFAFNTVIFILSLPYWTLTTAAEIGLSLMTIAIPVISFALLAQCLFV